MTPLAWALLFGIAPLVAQTTWVVDATGGPGTLPTLAAAEAQASPGDTIVVRPTAVYDFTLTTAKGLAILGAGPGSTAFQGRLSVVGLPAAQGSPGCDEETSQAVTTNRSVPRPWVRSML